MKRNATWAGIFFLLCKGSVRKLLYCLRAQAAAKIAKWLRCQKLSILPVWFSGFRHPTTCEAAHARQSFQRFGPSVVGREVVPRFFLLGIGYGTEYWVRLSGGNRTEINRGNMRVDLSTYLCRSAGFGRNFFKPPVPILTWTTCGWWWWWHPRQGEKKSSALRFGYPLHPSIWKAKKENAGCLIGDNHGHRGDLEVVHYKPQRPRCGARTLGSWAPSATYALSRPVDRHLGEFFNGPPSPPPPPLPPPAEGSFECRRYHGAPPGYDGTRRRRPRPTARARSSEVS